MIFPRAKQTKQNAISVHESVDYFFTRLIRCFAGELLIAKPRREIPKQCHRMEMNVNCEAFISIHSRMKPK